LDCWDGPDNEPIITHGFTLTSKIYFKDVVQIIHKYAFVASPYPIVLSLEVHCSPKQQDRMASILIQVLGETLVTSRFPAGVTVSPESLKNRILIKGRALAEQDASSNDIEDESDMSQTEEEPGVKDATNPKNIQMSPKLAALVVYQQSKKMKTVSESNTFKNHHVSSLSESKASKMITTSGMEEFINFTRNAFARIFPLGGRVDSSNLDPIPYWQVGCQMVALNYQNFDKSMQLNRGFFLQNNNFGYLLKPTLSVKPVVKVNLSITVLSAFYLPKPQNELKGEIVDPFVVVEFLSCSERGGKTKSNVFKSEFITDNGFNPVWNDIPMTGDPVPNLIVDETICNPEISFVTFTIFDEDLMKKDFLAAASIPYDCLRTGYRFVNLYDYHGKLLPFSHLLVYIKK
jgi:phosphatidylinositol phospholipase C delta